MEIIAESKNVRVSPRKLRLIVAVVKKLSPAQAVVKLQFLAKSGARPVLLVLQSALANAQNNFKKTGSELKIKNILVDEGIKMKRQDKSHSKHPGEIMKRTAHIRVTLEG